MGEGAGGGDAAQGQWGPPPQSWCWLLAPGLQHLPRLSQAPASGARSQGWIRPRTHEGPGRSLVQQSPLGRTRTRDRPPLVHHPHKHGAEQPPWFYRALCPSPRGVPPGRGGAAGRGVESTMRSGDLTSGAGVGQDAVGGDQRRNVWGAHGPGCQMPWTGQGGWAVGSLWVWQGGSRESSGEDGVARLLAARTSGRGSSAGSWDGEMPPERWGIFVD